MLKKFILIVALLALIPASAIAAEKAAPSKYTEVPFEETRDFAGISKSYPFTKPLVDNVIEINKGASSQVAGSIYIALIKNPKRQLNLFFLRTSGMLCGTSGCSAQIYIDRGNGYQQAFDSYMDGPAYLSSDGKDLVLSLCFIRNPGFSQWKLVHDTFVQIEKPDEKNPPPC